MVEVKIKKLDEKAILPSYGHFGDAGLDFHSVEEFVLNPGERRVCSTGIAMEIPEGHVAFIMEKSGLAAKKGIGIMGGVMDAHYRGEYKIIMHNSSKTPFKICIGDKIAQVVIQKVESAKLMEVSELSETQRGEGRFGSTGGSRL
jgi:dUTP pyrophosphatase